MFTLRSQLGTVGSSERVVNEPLELVDASGLYSTPHSLSFTPNHEGPRLTAKVRRVCVHTVKVRRSFHDGPFLRSKFGKAISEHLLHVLRIMSEIYRVLQEVGIGHLAAPAAKTKF